MNRAPRPGPSLPPANRRDPRLAIDPRQAHDPRLASATRHHQMFVYYSPTTDPAAHKTTCSLLQYVSDNQATLRAMDVEIHVMRIRPADLADPAKIAVLKHDQITQLPAVLTSTKVYTGLNAILNLYDRNIAEYRVLLERESAAPAATAEPDSDLDDWYRSQLASGRDDEDDERIGDTTALTNAFQAAMARRTIAGPATPIASRPGDGPPKGGVPPRAAAPPRGAQPPKARADNVGPPTDDTDVLFAKMIDQITESAPPATDAVFAAGGDGDGEDDSSSSVHDAFMERAYWANHVGSE